MDGEWREAYATRCFLPQRAILGIMGFFAVINAYTMRICLSVAITEMVVRRNRTRDITNHTICKPTDVVGPSARPGTGTYTWSEETIGIILSSFYWGYIITHLPGGLLADKFGGKYTLSLGLLSTAIFTLATPSSVKSGGAYSLIVLRVFMGFGEGTTFPALSALLADWMPLKERSFWGALVLGGTQVGTIVANSVSGLLISYFERWEVVFYFFGMCGILWFLLFTLLCYSDPSSHPCISIEEKKYLEEQLGTLQRDRTYPSPPWKHILTSAPFWALILGQLGHDWGFYIMVTYLPKYMADVLLFPIKESGLYSALPYFIMWCNSIGSAILSDYIIYHKMLSITATRKIYTSIAAIGPGIFMVLASKAGCNRALVIAHFTIGMTLMGCFYPSLKVNPIDLSPHYAGTLMAIVNGLGAIAGIVSPYMVGVLTPHASLNEWAIVFWVTFSILTASAIIYSIWASGLTQPWDNPKNLQ